MLKARFHRWAITKYITRKDSLTALDRIMAYRSQNGYGPGAVVVRGRTLSTEKVLRHLKLNTNKTYNQQMDVVLMLFQNGFT